FGGLILVLEGEDLYAQYWAAQALSKAPGVSSAAKATLLNIVSRRDVYRRAREEMQGGEGGFVAGVPIMALIALSNALGATDVLSVPILLDALTWDSEEARRVAAVGLGRVGSGSSNVVEALRSVSENDEDEEVREAAKAALTGIV